MGCDKKKVRKIQDGDHFRFGHILKSMQDSEKVFEQKVSQMTRCDKTSVQKSKMATTSGLVISWNLCEIAKKFLSKKCPK
jgi:hypothetical protein